MNNFLDFSKYHGLGNDFVIIDVRKSATNSISKLTNPLYIKKLLNRNFGIGADGLILINNPQSNAYARMQIFNSDGSEAEMCGNGIRCLCKYIIDNDKNFDHLSISVETLAGLILCEIMPDQSIIVDMGKPTLNPDEIPTTLSIGEHRLPQGCFEIDGISLDLFAVGMGNPHLIVPIAKLANINHHKLGPVLENHSAFPAKTNVHFLEVINHSTLKIIVWERGSGSTLACGTGACATLVASSMLGYSDKKANIVLPGGTLNISWPNENSSVYMCGPAEYVFSGQIIVM